MPTNLIISKNSKYYYPSVLMLLFITFGLIIALISTLISGYYQLHIMNKEFNNSAKNTLSNKIDFSHTQTENFKNYFMAVDKVSKFETFIQSEIKNSSPEKEHITALIMAITHVDPNIMQFRFIGKNGDESIRVERDSIGSAPYKVEENLLQNKEGRYYFQELRRLPKDVTWFSKLDLNIEHGKIVQPIVPTLRIAKPYYFNGEFKGMLIINLFMQEFLNEIMKSKLFNVAIIDKDFHILTNNLRGYNKDNSEWTRYLENAKGVKYTQSQDKNDFLLDISFKESHFSIELSDIIKNGEGLKIILQGKTEKLIEYTKDIKSNILFMTIIIFVISIPIALLLSSFPLRLHKELENIKNSLENELEIIDRYVYMTSTDVDGNITNVSTAYTQLSGYTKDELIGENQRILKDPDTPSSFYEEMWETILSGKSWTGECSNIGKNRTIFSIEAHITPILDGNKIVGFTSIRKDITDQKRIEEISIKDELTKAFNRRYFNQIFPKELNAAKRRGEMLCVAMFDIDYFKKYNDTYGHIKGDQVLQKIVTRILTKLQRASDYLFRVGGEEFMVLYSDMKNFEEAQKFSEELVMEIKNLQIEHSESLNDNVVTISLGLLAVAPACRMDKETILKRVDELLYDAKGSGRNRLISQKC